MSQWRLLQTDGEVHPLSAADQETLARLGVELVRLHSRSREEFLELAAGVDAILNSDFRITADLIPALRKCRLISRYGTGLDNIDVKSATSAGIAVANVPEFCTDALADRTFTLVLACACNLSYLNRYVREGDWGQRLRAVPLAVELRGKTLGLIGFGRIARAVADRAKGFGLGVCASDPYVDGEFMLARGVRQATLEVLLADSDFVSVHVPLPQETRHLLDAGRIALMKPTSILINTARGGVIDEPALKRALQERRLRAAGLDVFEQEPVDPKNPLFSLDNVMVTPPLQRPHPGSHR